MNIYEIPLTSANQTIRISILNTTYIIRTYYCNVDMGGWVFDISDASGNAILTGVPMVTGANLLEQYAYLGLGFGMFVSTDGDMTAIPTFDNLGTNGHLYVVVS